MLIIALVLAAIGLAALVFAVVTSNALVAWVCVVASLLGVLLLIVDALRDRRRNNPAAVPQPVEDTAGSDGDAEGADDADDVEDVAETSGTAETVDQAEAEAVAGESVDEAAEQPVSHPAD